MDVPSEFLFIDESGDPGYPGANPLYLLAGVHIPGRELDAVRLHLASFRYHHGVTKELKDWGALLKDEPTAQMKALFGFLADMTDDSKIAATVNWLEKDKYLYNHGPHLGPGASTIYFRNFQLRRLLERHKGRGWWSNNLDAVLDRWSMNDAQRHNLEQYLTQNLKLQPPLAHLTIVDSGYVEGVQLADMYARLARKVIEEDASDWHKEIVPRLMDIQEKSSGIYV